jgi:hypothetical protein
VSKIHLFLQNALDVYATAVVISSGGIDAGTSTISIYERCHVEASISLGGSNEGSASMSFSEDELDLLKSSQLVHFTSILGEIDFIGLSSNKMTEVHHLKLTTGNTTEGNSIEFKGAASTFRTITAHSKAGILIQEDITTTTGAIRLEFSGGNLDISAAVLTSETDLEIVSSTDNIHITLPTRLVIMNDVLINRPGSEKMNTMRTPHFSLVTVSRSNGQKLELQVRNMLTVNAAISLTGFGAITLDIYAKDMILGSSCDVDWSGDSMDVIKIRPYCEGATCEMGFGATASNLLNLDNSELNRLTTEGTIKIGDIEDSTTALKKIIFDGVTFGSGTADVEIKVLNTAAGSNIIFANSPSAFANSVTMKAYDTIKSSAAVSISNSLIMNTQYGCGGSGGLLLSSGGSFTSDGTMTITGGSISIPLNTFLSNKNSQLSISEICSLSASIALGSSTSGAEETGTMAYSGDELSRISADDIKLTSTKGSIISYGLSDSNFINLSQATLVAEEISFMGETNTFTKLDARAEMMTVSTDLSTSAGKLELNFGNGGLSISSQADLNANGGDLHLETSASGSIMTTLPTVLKSTTDDIILHAPVLATRSALGDKTLLLYGKQNLDCNSAISFLAEVDGMIVRVESKSIDLQTGCSISADSATDVVYLTPLCSTALGCSMDFGTSNESDWHMTNDEIDQITTLGSIMIADLFDTTKVQSVHFDGVTMTSSFASSIIIRTNQQHGFLEFSNGDTTMDLTLSVSTGKLTIVF